MSLNPRHFLLLSWIAVAAIAIAAYASLPWWTVDDAFIAYRYGDNLAVHGELNWNPGEPLVEGYTGILLPLLAALFTLLDLPLIALIKVLGILAWLGTIVFAERSLARVGMSPVTRGLALLVIGVCPIGYLHSLSGLETVFFALGLTLAAGSMLSLEANGQRAGRWTWVSLASGLVLAGLARPEGLAMLGVAGAWFFILRNRLPRSATWAVAAATALVLGYWAWRINHYGHLLPNTFYAKAYDGWVNPESLWAMAKFGGYYLALPIVLIWLVGASGFSLKRARNRYTLAAVVAFTALCLGAYAHSNLWMGYGSRFFFPLLPPLLLVLFASSGEENAYLVRKWVIAGVLCSQIGIFAFRYHQEWAWVSYYHRIVQDELIPAGRYLHNGLPAGARVASYMDAGAVGYYSKLPVIDFGKLSDPNLTQGHWPTARVVDYFYEQAPAAVVMSSSSPDRIDYIDEAMAIVADTRWKRYGHAAVFANEANYPYYQHIFLQIRPKTSIPQP